MSLILRRSLIFFGLMIAGLVLYALWFGIRADRYAETAVPYLESAVPELASWQYARLTPLLSPAARRDFENERMRAAYQSFAILGRYRSMEAPRFSASRQGSSEDLGDIEVIDYEVVTQFDSGPAVIKVKLFANGEKYYIHYFGIQSEVFADQTDPAKN